MTNLSVSPAEAARELLSRRKARRDLLAFTRYVKPSYRVNWHHRLLCSYLDRLIAGELNRLMVFMPPQHGKSELVSRMLPAYALGRDPTARIIGCSHTAELAQSLNRDVQRVMDGEAYRRLFPETTLPGRFAKSDSRAAFKRTTDLFEVVEHRGYLRSAGVGGAITGMGFTLGVIDDPFKSREEADSPRYRQKVWDWYANDFYTRRSGDASILLTHTRWHRDDLAGRLLRQQAEREADQWEVLSLPAIRTHEEPTHPDDTRQPGQALWPDFMPADELEKARLQDAKAFAALYQQDPAEAGGAEWDESHFGPWIWCPPEQWPESFDLRVVCVDPSKGKSDKQGDYSAIIFVGVKNGLVYVDADLERRPPHKICTDTIRFCSRHKPDMLGFEANQFQELLVHEFERVTGQQFGLQWHVYKLFNRVNKVVRIRRLGVYLANRTIRFKADSPGCHLLVDQLRDFPLGDHDDGPDGLEMAIRLPMEAAGKVEA